MQDVTLPHGTRVRIVQKLENGWDKIIVEAIRDTGQPPSHELIGFVNGTLLTVAASNPAPNPLAPSTASAESDTTAQSSPSMIDRLSRVAQILIKGFHDYQNNKEAADEAAADPDPDMAVNCVTKLLGYICTFTSNVSRQLIINEVIMNGRADVAGCITKTSWLFGQRLGDTPLASSLFIMGSNETALLGKPVLPTSSCFLVRLTGGRFFVPA